jgi:AcrR family transcriptional regulator
METPLYYMKISELAQQSGVSRHSIHHYLRLGLLPEPQHKNKTMAYYGQKHLERLQLIKHLRAQGFSLYIIQQILSQQMDGVSLENAADSSYGHRKDGQNKELKKKQLIEAASRVFSEKGYYHTSISDITDELDIGKSTFYLYFRNKKELFFSCIDNIFENLWKEDFERINAEENIITRLSLRREAFIRVYPQIRDILQMMRGASVGKEEDIVKKYNGIYAKLVRPVKRDLQEGMERGVLPPGDPELLAYVLTGMAEAVAYRIHLDDKYSIEDVMNAMRRYQLFR